MKQAILIFEWNRPNFLRICLDSLARVCGIKEWDIAVSIDGDRTPFDSLLKRCAKCPVWPDHAGNLWHVVRSLEWAVDQGYDRVLFMDGDVIMRTDALVNLPEQNPFDLLIGMRWNGHSNSLERIAWLSPQSNIIQREQAKLLLQYVRKMAWVGLARPGCQQIMGKSYDHYDAVFCRYMIDHGLMCIYRDRSYAGHIGVVGVDCNEQHLAAEIFTGPPETWLDNAIRIFNPARSTSFVPTDFVYG